MKKIVLICSHLHSGSTELYNSLNNHPRIQGYHFSAYSSPLDLLKLTNQYHKLNNRSSIYMDELLFNYNLSTSVAYKECKFIYVIREPEAVLNKLINDKIKIFYAIRYYSYRLRRIFEMSRRTPGAILLTWEDLIHNRGMNLIEDYLSLKEPINLKIDNKIIDNKIIDNKIGLTLLSEVEETYQKYLYYLKNQNLVLP